MAGTLVQSKALTRNKNLQVWTVTLVWTADGSGTFTGAALNSDILSVIRGTYLFRLKTFPTPAGTAPTAGYNVTLVDDDGYDILGGVGVTQSHSAVMVSVPKQDSTQNLYGPVLVLENNAGTLTLNVTGGGANASGTVRLCFTGA